MRQTGLAPEEADWVRPEVAQSWLRCIEDHTLPLGADRADMAPRPVPGVAAGFGGADIIGLLDRLGGLLRDAQLFAVVSTPDAALLYVPENGLESNLPMRELLRRGADWRETTLGNNGPGTAALLGQPAAFCGREHFSQRLHPYATVGYPLAKPDGGVAGVIGLIGDRNVGASVLLGVMGLIVRLLESETPLRNPGHIGTTFPPRSGPRRSVPPPVLMPRGAPYRDTLTEDCIRQVVRLQECHIPILVTGESGVGKEHLVRLAHAAGPRRNGPLVAINCASIPRELIESELFGYEGGSFTGARSQGKPGKFLLADKGVLFLDEIGDMSFDLQATLLRVLENSEFVPVGGARPVKVDVHVIAATNVRLLKAVEQGRFRRDLYYRLNGAQLLIPPLRDRPDKRELIESLLIRECSAAGVPLKQLSQDLRELFYRHPWPGNIRELRNLLRNLVSVVSDEMLVPEDLPADFLEELKTGEESPPLLTRLETRGVAAALLAPTAPSLDDWERHAIESALSQTCGNVAETARILGISRSTLYVKLQRYNLVPTRSAPLRRTPQPMAAGRVSTP